MSDDRKRTPPPERLERTIIVDELGGEVVVRQMVLWQALLMGAQSEQNRMRVAPDVLAEAVIYPDGEAVFDADGWNVFGANNIAVAARLLKLIRDLTERAGNKGEAEGNSPGPTSDSG